MHSPHRYVGDPLIADWRNAFWYQVQLHLEHVRSLAVEVANSRHSALALMFRPVSFVSTYHQAPIMFFTDSNKVLEHLPNVHAFARSSHTTLTHVTRHP